MFATPAVSEWGEVAFRGVTFSSLRFFLIVLRIVSLFWASRYFSLTEAGVARRSLIFYIFVLRLALFRFFSLDKFLKIYISFELSVLPIFIIIIGWGYQSERLNARLRLLFYTLSASMPLLISFIWLRINFSQNRIFCLSSQGAFNQSRLTWAISAGLFLAFAVKLPVFGAHLWLPKAHVEAPVIGSMVLAAILLKLGRYGLWLFLPIYFYFRFTYACRSIALMGTFLIRVLCLRLTDLKIIIAYSSVGHIGLIVGSLLTATSLGVGGAIFMILAHGARSSAIFLIAFIFYRVNHRRRILLTKGVITWCGAVPLFWFLVLIANMASPPTFNLLAELIVITRVVLAVKSNVLLIILIVIVRTGYSLIIYRSRVQGVALASASLSLMSLAEIAIISNHLIWAFLIVLGLGILN